MKRFSDLTSGKMPARSGGSRKRAVLAAFSAMALLPLPALADELNSGDTAWMLTATALVLFMTIPGLSLFYAGMVRSKNVLSVLMQCFAITSLMTVLWVLYGYSIAFGGGRRLLGRARQDVPGGCHRGFRQRGPYRKPCL